MIRKSEAGTERDIKYRTINQGDDETGNSI